MPTTDAEASETSRMCVESSPKSRCETCMLRPAGQADSLAIRCIPSSPKVTCLAATPAVASVELCLDLTKQAPRLPDASVSDGDRTGMFKDKT